MVQKLDLVTCVLLIKIVVFPMSLPNDQKQLLASSHQNRLTIDELMSEELGFRFLWQMNRNNTLVVAHIN